MIKKYLTTSLFFFLFYFAALCPLLWAEDEVNTGSGDALSRSLATNQSILARFEFEYQNQKKLETEKPSLAIKRKLSQIEYKMKAINEDADRLLLSLPDEEAAQEYLKNLVARQQMGAKLKSEKLAPPPIPLSPPTQKSLEQMHESALKLVQENKLEEALGIYQEIILQNPSDDEAYTIMGHIYLLLGEYEKSEMAFYNSASIDPENIEHITPFYQNMILQNPDDDIAYANLGYAYLMLADYEKAKDAFLEAIEINPENLKAQQGLVVAKNQGWSSQV